MLKIFNQPILAGIVVLTTVPTINYQFSTNLNSEQIFTKVKLINQASLKQNQAWANHQTFNSSKNYWLGTNQAISEVMDKTKVWMNREYFVAIQNLTSDQGQYDQILIAITNLVINKYHNTYGNSNNKVIVNTIIKNLNNNFLQLFAETFKNPTVNGIYFEVNEFGFDAKTPITSLRIQNLEESKLQVKPINLNVKWASEQGTRKTADDFYMRKMWNGRNLPIAIDISEFKSIMTHKLFSQITYGSGMGSYNIIEDQKFQNFINDYYNDPANDYLFIKIESTNGSPEIVVGGIKHNGDNKTIEQWFRHDPSNAKYKGLNTFVMILDGKK